MSVQPESRELLTSLGIGQFNATMMIPYMMIAPATTDPKAPQIMLLVQHIQRMLCDMGATNVVVTGRLDPATAACLRQVAGAGWERMSWGRNVQALLGARQAGMWLGPSDEPQMSGVADVLPSVPGGLLTYAAGAALAVYLLCGERRR